MLLLVIWWFCWLVLFFFLVIRVVICDCVIILGFYGVFKIYKKDFGYKEIEESDGCNEKEGVIGKVWFLNIICSI